MKCHFCGHDKTHKHGKTTKGSQRYYCPLCRQTFTDTFATVHYRRQVEPETIRLILRAYATGSSPLEISRSTKLAYNTVISLVKDVSQQS